MNKNQISNPRFELVNSPIKGYKEIEVFYNYGGRNFKYFIFIKEGKNVNYINEAKKQFAKDVKSGKVDESLKFIKKHSTSGRSWLVATIGVVSAAALALGGLFIWKALTNTGTSYKPGDSVEVSPEVVVPAGSTYSVNIENTKAKVGENYHTDITLGSSNLDDEEECYLPDKPVSVISGNKALKEEQYKYILSPSKLSATLDIEGKYVYGPIFVNLVVEAPGGEPATPWYLDDSYINSLTCEDVGTIQKVKVNGVDHKVRLIGIDHDEEVTESIDNPTPVPTTYAHTTWEFANFICDENGYSLATFWNDIVTPSDEVPCRDYSNSSIRYALMGDEVDYDDTTPIHGWYEKDEGTRSDTYKDPVIKMLPAELVENIKPVKKDYIYYDGSSAIVQTCEDKLFLLSSDEMAKVEYASFRTGTTYMYYYNGPAPSSPEVDVRRIKRQVKVLDGARTGPTIVTDSRQGSSLDVESIAGYNSTATDPVYFPGIIAGAGYWLRDIDTSGYAGSYTPYGGSSFGGVCNCYNSGHGGKGNLLATPIAPAFCL